MARKVIDKQTLPLFSQEDVPPKMEEEIEPWFEDLCCKIRDLVQSDVVPGYQFIENIRVRSDGKNSWWLPITRVRLDECGLDRTLRRVRYRAEALNGNLEPTGLVVSLAAIQLNPTTSRREGISYSDLKKDTMFYITKLTKGIVIPGWNERRAMMYKGSSRLSIFS